MHRSHLCLLAFALAAPALGQDKPAGFERSAEEIRETLKKINAPAKSEHEAAVRRLNAYRYLARVPHDVELDDEYNKYAQAASKLCKEVGKLDHRPKNPGWTEEEFQIAFKGTGSSNLAWGDKDLVAAVDGWMDDSDDSNIDRLGHRRWCLNPAMKKVGLGRTELFSAMYCFDMSRKKTPAFEYVAFPPAGYVPLGFFRKRYAWNVSLNPAKYDVPAKEVKVELYPLDEEGAKKDALKLDYFNVDPIPFGIQNAIIFRPATLDAARGRRYLVEVTGARTKAGGETVVRYAVEFVE